MVYRIRYRTDDAGDTEVAVEANSPTEALVKFRHTHGLNLPGVGLSESVTSVSLEDAPPAHP